MLRRTAALFAALLAVLALAACSSSPWREAPRADRAKSPTSVTPPVGSANPQGSVTRGGAYYKDDGPGENPPDFDKIADAQPRSEPLHRFANNPYQVFGKNYVPLRTAAAFRQRGVASWYGRRYHGQKTSSGEIYDMYAMTAAHPTLPIPSYVRVTSVVNSRSVIVRVNDRGPFHSDRIIDLSFVAAYKLGYTNAGSALVDVEIVTGQSGAVAEARPPAPSHTMSSAAPVESAALPLSSEPNGVYLQLGAFSVRDNAESFRVRVYKELDWLTDAMQLSAQGGMFRLRLGPYRTQDEARRIAERIQTELNLKPVLLVR